MGYMVKCCLVVSLFAIAQGSYSVELETFIEETISTWQLVSPTLLVQGDLPSLCMRLEWILCLSTDFDTDNLVQHLALIYNQRKQDGVFYLGSQGHEEVLEQLGKVFPAMLTSNYPIFMPYSYHDKIKLRLDSNILFYEEKSLSRYELYDIFAVKAEPPIIEQVGNWDMKNGLSLLKSMNRWDRRRDLKGAPFVNAVMGFRFLASFIRDENGNITGTTGYSQEQLFHIIDKLNVTTEIVETPWNFTFHKNGFYGGGLGMLQRREVDVFSIALGINLNRSHYIDYPLPTLRNQRSLIAAIRNRTSISVWVYVRVFGLTQWIVSLAVLMVVATCISVSLAMTTDKSNIEFGTKKSSKKDYKLNSISSGFALVYLYVIQMGSHTNSSQLSARFLTFTISLLTLLLFTYYTTDITSEMTTGPPKIPIRNFQDVIDHN